MLSEVHSFVVSMVLTILYAALVVVVGREICDLLQLHGLVNEMPRSANHTLLRTTTRNVVVFVVAL